MCGPWFEYQGSKTQLIVLNGQQLLLDGWPRRKIVSEIATIFGSEIRTAPLINTSLHFRYNYVSIYLKCIVIYIYGYILHSETKNNTIKYCYTDSARLSIPTQH